LIRIDNLGEQSSWTLDVHDMPVEGFGQPFKRPADAATPVTFTVPPRLVEAPAQLTGPEFQK
jgi:hypothetical protein